MEGNVLTIEYASGLTTAGDIARAIGTVATPQDDIPFTAAVTTAPENYSDFPAVSLIGAESPVEGEIGSTIERTLSFGDVSLSLQAVLDTGYDIHVELRVDASQDVAFSVSDTTVATIRTILLTTNSTSISINDLITEFDNLGLSPTINSELIDTTVNIGSPLGAFPSGTFTGGEPALASSTNWEVDGAIINVDATTAGIAGDNISLTLVPATGTINDTILSNTTPVVVTIVADAYTVYALPDVATHNDLVAALNSEAGLTASLVSGTSELLDLYPVTLTQGDSAVASTTSWDIDGVVLNVAASSSGIAGDNLSLSLVPAAGTINGATLSAMTPVVVAEELDVYTIYALPGVATHADVVDALNLEEALTASIASGTSALLDLYSVTLTGGEEATSASAVLTIDSVEITISPVTESDQTLGNSQTFFLLGDTDSNSSNSSSGAVVDIPNMYGTGESLTVEDVDTNYRYGSRGTSSPILDSYPSGWREANTDSSKWISSVDIGNSTAGNHDFYYEYSLDGLNPETAVIELSIAADNAFQIFHNGNQLNEVTTNGYQFVSFTIDEYFVEGTNEILFRVVNGGTSDNPMGLKVEFDSATAQTIPKVSINNVGDTYTVNVREGSTHADVVAAINDLGAFTAEITNGTSAVIQDLTAETLVGWSAYGETTLNGSWAIQSDNITVYQSVNTAGKEYFVNDTDRTDFVLQSTLLIDQGDDDDVGYVVGWEDPSNHVLFRWADGGFSQGIAGSNRSLELYDSTIGNISLATDSVRWSRNVEYAITIFYSDTNIKVEVDGTTVFDVNVADVTGVDSFQSGGYGFYNYSQGGVNYGNVMTGEATSTSGGANEIPSSNSLDVQTSGEAARYTIQGPIADTEIILDASALTASTTYHADENLLIVSFVADVTSVIDLLELINAAAGFTASLNYGVDTDLIAVAQSASLSGGADGGPSTGTMTLQTSSGSATLAIEGPNPTTQILLNASVDIGSTAYDSNENLLIVSFDADTTSVNDLINLINGAAGFTASLNSGVGADSLAIVQSASLSGGADAIPPTATVTVDSGSINFTDTTGSRNGNIIEVVMGAVSEVTASENTVTIAVQPGDDSYTDIAAVIDDAALSLTTNFTADIGESSDSPIISDLTSNYVAGSAATDSSGDLFNPGSNNDFSVVATPRLEGYSVRFVDSSNPEGGASISIDTTNSEILLSLSFGISSANEVVTALETPFMFETVLAVTDDSNASGELDVQGNLIFIEADHGDTIFDGIRVVLVGDSSSTALTSAWTEDTVTNTRSILTLTYVPDQTTLSEIISAISDTLVDLDGDPSTTIDNSSLTASISSGDPDFAFISLGGALLSSVDSGNDGNGVINAAPVGASSIPVVESTDEVHTYPSNPRNFTVLAGQLYFLADEVLEDANGNLTSQTTHLYQRHAGSGDEEQATSILTVSGDSVLTSGQNVLYLMGAEGLRLVATDGDIAVVDTAIIDATAVSFGEITINTTADAIAVLNGAGVVQRIASSDTSTVSEMSASQTSPWTELGSTVGSHNNNLYLTNTVDGITSLYVVDGLSPTLVASFDAGSTVTTFFSTTDAIYLVETDSSGSEHLHVIDTSLTSLALAEVLHDLVMPSLSSGRYSSFAVVGSELAYVYAQPGNTQLMKISLENPTDATLIHDLGNGTLSQLTVAGSQVFFRFGSARGTALWVSDWGSEDSYKPTPVIRLNSNPSSAVVDPDNFVTLNERIYYTAPNDGSSGLLWTAEVPSGEINYVGAPLAELVDSVVPALRVSMAATGGDGLIDASDASLLAGATLVQTTTETDNEFLVDLTELVRSALTTGQTRLTILLQLDSLTSEPVTLAHAHSEDGTQLQVVQGSAGTITGSLYTVDGRLLQSDESVIDLSQLSAGVYFLRIDGASDQITLNNRGSANVITGGNSLATAGDYTYYLYDDKLWRTNGTNGLTAAVVASGGVIIEDSTISIVEGAGDSLFFTRGTGSNTKLWEVSGAFANLVSDLTGAITDSVAVGATLFYRDGDVIYSTGAGEPIEIIDASGSVLGKLARSGARAVFTVDGSWYASMGTANSTSALDYIDANTELPGSIVATENKLYYFENAPNGDDLNPTLWAGQIGEGESFGAEPLSVAALDNLDVRGYRILGVFEGRVIFTVIYHDGSGLIRQLWASNGSGDTFLGGQDSGTLALSVYDADTASTSNTLAGDVAFVGIENDGSSDRLYFTVSDTQNNNTQLLSTRGLAGSTRIDIDSLPGIVGTAVDWEGDTYFLASQTKGAFETGALWKMTTSGVNLVSFVPKNAAQLTATASSLVFVTSDNLLYVSDGTASGTRLVVDLSPVSPGTISGIASTANGFTFLVRNDNALLDGFLDYSLWTSNGYSGGTYPLLSSNGGGLPYGTEAIAPTLLNTVGEIAFYEFDGNIYATDGTTTGTRTLGNDFDVADTLASAGDFVLLESDGTLWISDGNLVGASYRLEAKAPIQGNAHSFADRDNINGGEGNDTLIGNNDHDLVFGGGGTNFFIAESKEIRDLQSYENFGLPPTSEYSVQQPRQSDTEVTIPDEALAAAIAEALGLAVTLGFDGNPVIHGKIMASRMASLVELQAPQAGIQSVVGLHFARNLEILNLNGNRISDLSILVPATDPVSGAQTGLSNLRVFSLAYNGMGILTLNGEKSNGVGEYVDILSDVNEITSTVTLWFRTDATNTPQALISFDDGVRGSGGMDRSIFLDSSGNLGALLYGGASIQAFYPNAFTSNQMGYELIRSSNTNYADGNWHHVAYVFSADGVGTAQRLYVDGVEVARGKLTSSSLSTQTGINIGYGYAVDSYSWSSADNGIGEVQTVVGGVPYGQNAAYYFAGDLDEVRIWDAALTDVQVNSDMVQPYPAEQVYLAGYWSFDGPSSGVAIDHSLYRNNGIFGGGNSAYAPAINRFQPDAISRPTPYLPQENGQPLLTSADTLFPTIIRDLQRLNIPGPIEKLDLSYTRVDNLSPLSALVDLDYINLSGVVNSDPSSLGVIVDHTDPDATISQKIVTKDGTTFLGYHDTSLVLSAGLWAWQRLTLGGGVDGDENFTLSLDNSSHVLSIAAFDVTDEFDLSSYYNDDGSYAIQVVFDGGVGEDSLVLSGDFPIEVYATGGAGDDELYAADATTYLFGGTGSDTLYSGSSTAILTGGNGDDIYVFTDNWGAATINENPGGGSDTLDFSAVTTDLTLNLRGISTDGNNTVTHLANTINGIVGGSGNDLLNFHRANGGALELGDGVLTWDGTAVTHSGVEGIDVSFVTDEGLRTGAVQIVADQDYTGLDLYIEAAAIAVEASVNAGGLSLQSDSILAVEQNLTAANGLGRILTLNADRMRLASTGGVGDVALPIFINAGVIEARTEGAAGIYIAHIGDSTISDVNFSVADLETEGLETGSGGDINFINLFGTMTVDAEVQASGGQVILTAEAIDVNATISSRKVVDSQTFRGSLIIQPLSLNTDINLATATGSGLHLNATEISYFMSGFNESAPSAYFTNDQLVVVDSKNGITIGRSDGRHDFTLDTFTYSESFTFRAPEPFGDFNVIGKIELINSQVDGDDPALTFFGWDTLNF